MAQHEPLRTRCCQESVGSCKALHSSSVWDPPLHVDAEVRGNPSRPNSGESYSTRPVRDHGNHKVRTGDDDTALEGCADVQKADDRIGARQGFGIRQGQGNHLACQQEAASCEEGGAACSRQGMAKIGPNAAIGLARQVGTPVLKRTAHAVDLLGRELPQAEIIRVVHVVVDRVRIATGTLGRRAAPRRRGLGICVADQIAGCVTR